MSEKYVNKLGQIGVIILLPLLLWLSFSVQWAGQIRAQEPEAEEAPGSDNLIFNGNFEFGFYPVPELGFEARDIGHVPNDWNWFRSEAYGKYNIYNNEGLGLVCADDIKLETVGKNSLSIHMQSTDQSDARLGIYQTVNVVPGQEYLFAISGTIQVQSGASSPDINHRVELVFDHTGGSNWRAIPHDEWTLLPWREQELEFKITGPDDPDLATVEDYYTVVKAKSDRMTIFLGAWRRWANWRTAIFTFDCVSLIPLNKVDVPPIVPRLSELSTTSVDDALEASSVETQPEAAPAAEPAVASDTDAAPAAEPAIIPPSGGILETKRNSLLIIIVSVIVISGLLGAGIWNIQRRKQQADSEKFRQ